MTQGTRLAAPPRPAIEKNMAGDRTTIAQGRSLGGKPVRNPWWNKELRLIIFLRSGVGRRAGVFDLIIQRF